MRMKNEGVKRMMNMWWSDGDPPRERPVKHQVRTGHHFRMQLSNLNLYMSNFWNAKTLLVVDCWMFMFKALYVKRLHCFKIFVKICVEFEWDGKHTFWYLALSGEVVALSMEIDLSLCVWIGVCRILHYLIPAKAWPLYQTWFHFHLEAKMKLTWRKLKTFSKIGYVGRVGDWTLWGCKMGVYVGSLKTFIWFLIPIFNLFY